MNRMTHAQGTILVTLTGVFAIFITLFIAIKDYSTKAEIKFLNHEICEQSNELQALHGWPESKRLNCETFKLRRTK